MEDDLYKCIHCGFCLQACPTYRETGLETESPRGRIALMKAVHEQRISITPTVYRHWDLCVQCRACEIACPSGVPYGDLIETTMAYMEPQRKLSIYKKMLGKILLEQLIPYQNRLGILIKFLRIYQLTGIQWIIRRTKVLQLLSSNVSEIEKSYPTISGNSLIASGQEIPSIGKKRGRVALLTGCVMPLINGPQMRATIRVLAHNGCTVELTAGQVCCGAINSHSGDLRTARKLAKRNIDVFQSGNLSTLIVASAGCGARMKQYDELLKDDPIYSQKALSFSAMVKDIHEYLIEIGFRIPKSTIPLRVTYQDSCHLANAQKITDAPRQILESIPGVEFVEMEDSMICCGAGGAYSITQREFSLRILRSKMKNVKNTNADVVVTANPGCLLQLQNGIQRSELTMQVKYITDLLDEAYSAEESRKPNHGL